MDSEQFVSLAFIFVVNVLFLLSGICLNALVIISFSRSKQLRKKLCYFMIMVLSCCDFLAVITNNLFVATIAILTLTGKLRVHHEWIHICFKMTQIFPIFSLHALVVMNFDRYLATSRPLFHRRSVTKKRLAILFTVLILAETLLATLSANDAVISYQAHVTFVSVVVVPLTLFVNLKLFVIARRNSRKNRISPGSEKRFSLKSINGCLLAFACFVLTSVPAFLYVGLKFCSTDEEDVTDDTIQAGIWAKTSTTTNCTFNCLIFYWKNKTLRMEGLKVLKSMKKVRRQGQC